jgi:DNA-binding NarL/FixJ family response regulator
MEHVRVITFTESTMSITLLVADDHEVIRSGIASIVSDADVEVVANAATGSEAFELTTIHRPDVVLLDVRLPDGDGLTILERIKEQFPDQAVVMLSAFDNPTYVAKAVKLGANGYLIKSCDRQKVIHAIEQAAAGESLWTREEMRRVTGALATPRLKADVEAALTAREAEVLRAVTDGQTNEQVAKTLGISYETVKEHVQHVLRKIGVETRTQAAVWAVRQNIG